MNSITIGDGIQQINNLAFSSCSSLSHVYCYATMAPITKGNPFYNTNLQKVTLHVPNESLNSYSNTYPWNQFKDIVGLHSAYVLSYIIDGELYKQYEITEGSTITPEPEPSKEGHTFSGWSNIPVTMPAHDVTVIGSFIVNQYTVTYIVNNVELMTEMLEYGATITPPATDNEGHEIIWNSHPTTMPAYDITIYGSVSTGISEVSSDNGSAQIFSIDGKRLDALQKGMIIVHASDGSVKKMMAK